MYLVMCAHITFPASGGRAAFSIRRINYCRVERSWESLTNKAEIRLPRNVSDLQKDEIRTWIKRGDQVIIELGYNGQYNREFEGYVTEVGSDFPIVIQCEDEMYKLKQGTINVSMEDATLKSLLQRYVNGYEIVADDVKVGTILKENTTPALLLEELKEKGIYSYFQNGTLYSGITAPDPPRGEVSYQLETNIRPDTNNLVYQLAESILVQINASSKDAFGDPISVSVGDAGGEYKRMTFLGVESEAALRIWANKELNRLKVDGYKGSFETYGIPYVDHGYIAHIESYQYPDRNGSFYVKGVITTFGVDGYKRKVTLDRKAA